MRESSLRSHYTSACTRYLYHTCTRICALVCTCTYSTKRPCEVAFWPGGCKNQLQTCTRTCTLQAAQLCARHTGRPLSRATKTKEIGLRMQSSRSRMSVHLSTSLLLCCAVKGTRTTAAHTDRHFGSAGIKGVRYNALCCMRVKHMCFTGNTLTLVGAHQKQGNERGARLSPRPAGLSKRPIRRSSYPLGCVDLPARALRAIRLTAVPPHAQASTKAWLWNDDRWSPLEGVQNASQDTCVPRDWRGKDESCPLPMGQSGGRPCARSQDMSTGWLGL